jgi:hypothetical protein
MKSIFKIFGLLAISGAMITACGSDDETENNTVTIDPNKFEGTFNTGEIILDASKTYKLTGKVIINAGASLTIPAGTKIEGTAGTASYIVIAQGGKIFVNGTVSNPVVMTSGLASKKAGDWGGLVICGKAPINRVSGGATTAQSEVAELTYGGTVANDNSGSVRYLRIEYAGAAFNSEKEFNGLSLFGVGSGTVVEYVEAYQGADDGFEFFGGTVNTSNLLAYGNEDDQFDWTEGWNGTNTNWYGKIAFGKGNRGIEADNFELGFANTPISNPSITNLTLVGPGSAADGTIYTENQGLKLRRGTKGVFSNVVLAEWKTGIDIEHDETVAAVTAGTLKATNVLFTNVASKAKGKGTDPDGSGPLTAPTANVDASFIESATATGAGNGAGAPTWTASWTVGF